MAVSADSVFSNKKFAEEVGANSYPVLADWNPHGKWAKEFGLWVEDKGCASRSNVVIDKDGVVRDIYTHPIGEDRDFNQLLGILDKVNKGEKVGV